MSRTFSRRPGAVRPLRRRASLSVLFWLSVAVLGFPGLAASAPAVDLHELIWKVHVDLIDAGAGKDLAYWQGLIDDAVASGNQLLEGEQGPFDGPCCTRIGRGVAVTTFGTPGDGLDVMNSLADQNAIAAAAGSGSFAFLIDSLTYCGGSAPTAIGCGFQSGCNGNGNDDPDVWMVVTVESLDDGVLPSTIAHERGHNACLAHVSNDACQLMQGSIFLPGNGGCLTATECNNYRAGRTTTSSGLECGCLVDATTIEADGATCTEVAGGLCSGGVCGGFDGNAGVRLIAAAAPGASNGGPPDDAVEIAALTGNWTTLSQFAPTADDVRGLAYAHDSGTLYGVVPTVNDDLIVTIDPMSGTILAVVGSIGNGVDEFVSMAYDPGDTAAPGDDRLLVLEADGVIGEIRWIDPASPSTANLLGSLIWSNTHLFTGLAYDSIQDRLFAATPFGVNPDGPFGLYEIDLSTCPPSPCISNLVPTANVARDDASLTYSPITGMLYLIGTAHNGTRTFYDVIDPATGQSVDTRVLDGLTPAGLAAVPEPGPGVALATGIMGLAAVVRRRALRTSRSGLRSDRVGRAGASFESTTTTT